MPTEDLYSQDYEFTVTRKALKPLPPPNFTGMKLARDIILGEFIFNSIDEYGVTWVVTDIDGWWSPPEAEMPDVPRGYGDGSYDAQGKYRARSLTLSGTFLTPDPSLVEAARDRLTKAADLVYKGVWLLAGKDPIRASFVRLSGGVKMNTVNARGRTDFEIPLRAFDPIKYSWNSNQPDGYEIAEINVRNIENPSSGVISINNIGNYPVPIQIEVSGPIIGPATIYNKTTDELIIITSPLLGANGSFVENKQLTFDRTTLQDVATLTTRTAHGFSVGREITVSGVGTEFNGTWEIDSVPTATTLTYVVLPEVSIVKPVIYKSLTGSTATLEIDGTINTALFSVGSTIFVSGVDTVFNGSYTITARTTNSISYTRNRARTATVTGRILELNQATLTTSSQHNFIVGESVVVSGVDSANFDGTYTINAVSTDGLKFSYAKSRTDSKAISTIQMTDLTITATTAVNHGCIVGESVKLSSLPSAISGINGSYTVASVPALNRVTLALVRPTRKTVSSKAASGGTATLITSTPHGLVPGERVVVEGIDATFNGTYTVTSTPSSTAFTYAKAGTVTSTQVVNGYVTPDAKFITSKSIIGNVATLTTLNAHGMVVGESITVANVDATFNGTYSVSAVTENSFSYQKIASNVSLTNVSIRLATYAKTGTTVTLTTTENHGFSAGNQVVIQGLPDSSFNGFFTLLTASTNTMTYTSSVSATVASTNAPEGSYVIRGAVTLSGDIPSTSIPTQTPALLELTGSLPFRTSSGTATVGADITRSFCGGVVVKENNVQFTPGVTNETNTATVVVSPDLLEIDTYDREVAFNGESIGARGKIDVLADFIRLAPGINEIEFKDSGTPESDALMKIYYRSGWLT